MKFSIRGGLGYQMLSLIACHAQAIEANDRIEAVTLYLGKYDDPINADIAIDYFTEMLIVDFPISKNYDEVQKTKFFDTKTIQLVLKHLDEIRRRIIIKDNDAEPVNGTILHVRQHDRPVVSIDYYEKIYVTVPIAKVIGDDGEFSRFFPTAAFSFSPDDAIDDWLSLYKSKEVIGGFSSFTLAAALLNPELRLRIIHPALWTPGTVAASDEAGMSLLLENLDNISWY
jgi:hypothetical protein